MVSMRVGFVFEVLISFQAESWEKFVKKLAKALTAEAYPDLRPPTNMRLRARSLDIFICTPQEASHDIPTAKLRPSISYTVKLWIPGASTVGPVTAAARVFANWCPDWTSQPLC